MSVINNNLLLTAAAGGTATAGRSIRLNAPDSAYLSRTPASAGNRKTWTWSGWVKLCSATPYKHLFTVNNGVICRFGEGADNKHVLHFSSYNGTTFDWILETAAVYRDVSSWMHLMFVLDTTQATSSNRLKIYVNGSQVTTFTTATYPNQNTDWSVNNTVAHSIGNYSGAYYGDFYLALVHFIDGQALTPSSFGETSATTGRWEAKTYAGSYSGNSFFLDFLDNSAATATTLGKDSSGLGNNWVPNNLVVSGTAVTGKTTPYQSYGTSDPYILFNGTTSPIASGSWPTDNTYLGHGQTSSFVDSSVITFSPAITAGSSIYVYANRQSSGGNIVVNVGLPSETTVTIPTTGWAYTSTGVSTIYNIQMKASTSGSNVLAGLQFFSTTNNSSGRITSTPANNIDSLRDHPTSAGTSTGLGSEVSGNYATLNPLTLTGSAKTYANGNLEVTATSNNNIPSVVSTFGARSGKWYAEVVAGWSASGIGFINADSVKDSIESSYGLGTPVDGWTRYGTYIFNNGVLSSGLTSIATNDLLQLALDLDNGKAWFGINGTWENSGNPANGTNPSVTFTPGGKTFLVGSCFRRDGTAVTMVHNYGARAFAYTAPSGFSPLVDTLLPSPVVAKPSTVMDVKLYTGNGSTQTVSNLLFSPDLVWIKSRSSGTYWHELLDSVRGANKSLFSNATNAEETRTNRTLNSDGFTVVWGSADDNGVNANSATYAAWCFDAGTTATTNTAGSIQSSTRVNTSSGFSICTYTGNGTLGATFGHSLGVAPSFFVIKRRSASNDWCVYHKDVGATKFLTLNSTAAATTSVYAFNNTAPTSSLITIDGYGGEGFVNANGATYVCYAFSPVAGYSSMSSFVGNGSSDGPFVYCGFRPRWILVKSTGVEAWEIIDAARDTYNVATKELLANSSAAESTIGGIDLLSNGFKIRNAGSGFNSSSQTYIYAAFAENPFQYARAR